MLCRSTAYDRKRHYDSVDAGSYVGGGDMRLAKDSRMMSGESESLMTAGGLGGAPTLLMAPPIVSSSLQYPPHTLSSAAISYSASLHPSSSMQH